MVWGVMRLKISYICVCAWALVTPSPLCLGDGEELPIAHEQPPVSPWIPAPRPTSSTNGDCRSHVIRDGFVSTQVNVDRFGCNIPGDAANESSIAVSATDPRKMVIGWRQFDTVGSSFRQAGYGYSHDAGHTWVFPGILNPGEFRSDPVLDSGPDGTVYFFSPRLDGPTVLFRTYDGGSTWAAPSQANPGLVDKPWMAVDRTNGIGRGNIYIADEGRFFQSSDGGDSFDQYHQSFNGYPTLAVAPDGVVYVASPYSDVSKSINAQNPDDEPTFEYLGFVSRDWGSGQFGAEPNPGGLFGQTWVATDHSNGPTRGNVYLFASVLVFGDDPLDVRFTRSTNGGMTWSEPIRVNDDPLDNGAHQWFGMMSVAPNGRIDVAWNDTRNSGQATLSELFYSYSTDAGDSWSKNIPVSPMFDSHVGWPAGQTKIGDYYHMVSDNLGVNVAYAATFNGEQDIYFLRIGPWDCNGNETDDALDISELRSRDCNVNEVPDECEYRVDINGDGLTTLADFATFQLNLTGPGIPIAADCTGLLDPDHDGDIDLHDFYLFQHVYLKP